MDIFPNFPNESTTSEFIATFKENFHSESILSISISFTGKGKPAKA